MRHTKVIAFANNKGGSGKSTTASNVGAALAQAGKRVLMIDGDMQMNLTLSFMDEEQALTYAKNGDNLYSVMKNGKDLSAVIIPALYENLDLVPSSTLMSGIEFDLFTKWQREFILKKALDGVKTSGEYDYIFIDAPPTLGGWVMNIICASDYVVIPVEASPWGVFGLANMVEFIEEVRAIAPQVAILGIAITKADERKKYFKETSAALREQEAFPLFNTIIHTDSAVEWAQDQSTPVVTCKRSSRSAKEYTELAKEIENYAGR
ncbi:MAG: ParA family protein [Clostridia bacterium]|nr:ParA family protein [Clostridia bacterium]